MSILSPGCDKCIWDLIDDLRLAALSIEESKSGLLSVSSGAAAHRHVNELNSTIYLLKVCSHVVPSAISRAGFAWSLPELLSLLSSESHGRYYRWIVRLGNYQKFIVTMSSNLNQWLPSIKEVKVLSKITKTSSIFVPNYRGKENTHFFGKLYIDCSGPYYKLTITLASICNVLASFSRNLSPALSLPPLPFLLTDT